MTDGSMWNSNTDSVSGQTYWYHTETGETRWDNPNASSGTGDGHEWQTMHDPTSGKAYYVHTGTHETRWDKPADLFV